jgi:hypothetical protein
MAFDRAQAIFALTTGMVSEEERELIVRKLETDEIEEIKEANTAVGAKVMFTKLVDPAKSPAEDPAFLQHCDDVWKARRDAVLKDLVAAYHEDAAKVSGKENSMFKTEVEKARTGGLSRTEAMTAARHLDPKAFSEYRRQSVRTAKADGLPRRLVKTAAQEEFESRVNEIQQRNPRINKADAVAQARKEHPELLKRAYPELAKRVR